MTRKCTTKRQLQICKRLLLLWVMSVQMYYLLVLIDDPWFYFLHILRQGPTITGITLYFITAITLFYIAKITLYHNTFVSYNHNYSYDVTVIALLCFPFSGSFRLSGKITSIIYWTLQMFVWLHQNKSWFMNSSILNRCLGWS